MKKLNLLLWPCALLTGCLWGGFYSLVSDDKPEAEAEHSCACVPDKTTKRWYWCDENGKRDDEHGERTCCAICNKVCPAAQGRKPAPVPVPLPPDCDHLKHCRDTEKCAIAPDKCCAECHQPCPQV